MEKITRNFYKKDIEYNKFFGRKKKISFDTNEHFLEIIDKLAKSTSNSRTVIINALIGMGMAPFFKNTEKILEKYLKEYQGKEKEKFKKNMRKTIEELKKLKKAYHIE